MWILGNKGVLIYARIRLKLGLDMINDAIGKVDLHPELEAMAEQAIELLGEIEVALDEAVGMGGEDDGQITSEMPGVQDGTD